MQKSDFWNRYPDMCSTSSVDVISSISLGNTWGHDLVSWNLEMCSARVWNAKYANLCSTSLSFEKSMQHLLRITCTKIQTFEIWFCYVGTEQIYKHWILPLTNLRLFEVNQSLNPLTQTWNQVKIKNQNLNLNLGLFSLHFLKKPYFLSFSLSQSLINLF